MIEIAEGCGRSLVSVGGANLGIAISAVEEEGLAAFSDCLILVLEEVSLDVFCYGFIKENICLTGDN